MSGHFHTANCWKHYRPCGEHHRHDYNCGDGLLDAACPDYEAQRRKRVHQEARLLARRLYWDNWNERDETFAREVLQLATKMVEGDRRP